MFDFDKILKDVVSELMYHVVEVSTYIQFRNLPSVKIWKLYVEVGHKEEVISTSTHCTYIYDH